MTILVLIFIFSWTAVLAPRGRRQEKEKSDWTPVGVGPTLSGLDCCLDM